MHASFSTSSRRQAALAWAEGPAHHGVMSRWHNIDYLDLIPEHVVGHEPGAEPGKVRLLTPRYGGPVLGRLLQPRLRGDRRWVRVPLDARGSWLWRHIDGRTSVRDLVRGFAAAFPDETDDAAERVCQYVESLVQNRFLRHTNTDDLRACGNG